MPAIPLPCSIPLASPEATRRLASRLAGCLRPGDVLLLEGSVGAGKTAFARALIQHLLTLGDRPPEDVPSPTFTLVQTYETPGFEIWHADLYRLSHPDEVLELGLADAFENAVCLIEWPDRLGTDTPPGAATLRFEVTDQTSRRLTLDGGPLARRLAEATAFPEPETTP